MNYLTDKTKVKLKHKTGELDPDIIGKPSGLPPVGLETLSKIIKELNERFGTEFTEEDRMVVHQIEQKLAQDERLNHTIRVNTPENAMLNFNRSCRICSRIYLRPTSSSTRIWITIPILRNG